MQNLIREDVRGFLIPAFLVYSAGLLVALLEFFLRHEAVWHFTPVKVGAAVVVLAGLCIASVAAITLRRSYSATLVTREDHTLITHGIYGHVRHPIYLGVLIAVLTMPLLLSSFFGIIVETLLIPLFLRRIKMEERMLTDEYGAEYKAYVEATNKLIPFVHVRRQD